MYLTGVHLMGVYLITLFRGCTATFLPTRGEAGADRPLSLLISAGEMSEEGWSPFLVTKDKTG